MKEVAVIVIISTCIYFALIAGAMKADQYNCDRAGRLMGYDTKYLKFDQCYVNTANGWIPLKNLQEFKNDER